MDDDGRIAAVGPEHSVPIPPSTLQQTFPGCVLLPGFVNAHTHLELTDFGGPLEAPDFFEWLQVIRRGVAARTPAMMLQSARQGVLETWRHGTTTVADTGSSGAVARALAELGGRGIAYQEVFGPHPSQVQDAISGLRQSLERAAALASERVTVGVSPHAPYTVSGELFAAVARLARREDLPVAVHLAESADETELLTRGAGRFAESLLHREVPLPTVTRSPVEYVRGFGLLDVRLLAIHCVQTDRADHEVLATHSVSVATCPTSNHFHAHGSAPLQGFREAGIRLGVGTDSVASVGSVNLLREARRVRDELALSAEDAVKLVTLNAAASLDLDRQIGSVERGKWADFVAIRLTSEEDPVEEQVLRSTPVDVMSTFVAGKSVYSQDQSVE